MAKNTLRSIGALITGAAVSILLEVGTDALMHAMGIFPKGEGAMSDALFSLATAYRTIFGVLGAYITARPAPNRPMLHALILGALGTVAAAAGAIAMWDKMPRSGRNGMRWCSLCWRFRRHGPAENCD